MHLKDYIQGGSGRATALAKALDVPLTYLSQMASGERAINPQRAMHIETLTDKAVMRWDCRPTDWHLIWLELIEADGAPAIHETEVKAD